MTEVSSISAAKAPLPDVFDAAEQDAFVRAFCDKTCQLFDREPSDRFEALFPWQTINDLLTLNLLDTKRMRVVKDGRDLPLSFYRRENDHKSLDAGKLTTLLHQGASLAINSVQYFVPQIRALATQFERWSDQKVNVNAYLSFGKGGAFTSHYDTHDVLVLQVYGNKAWTIFDEPAPVPILEHSHSPRHGGRGKPVLMEPMLRPGSMVFVPRGYFHQAAVQKDVSVHLTFGIRSARAVDYLDVLRKRCLDEALFREDVHAVGGDDALEAHEASVKARLHQMIDEFSFAEFLAGRRNRRGPFDLFHLGPAPALDRDTVLVPLMRGTPSVAQDDPIVAAVLTELSDNYTLTFGRLCDSLAGLTDTERLRATVSGLLADRLIAAE